MKIKILKDERKEMEFEVTGDDVHSFCNLLRVELLAKKDVVTAKYSKEHPLRDKAVFIIKTKRKKPTTVLKTVIKKIKKDLDAFGKKVKSALK